MRLTKIKLAGFKSFIDPTAVSFPSNLVGVVGPNGCGKSNIIDAVRWVMGEISAKHLRGDSMADVIFNGSGSRKPVGQASVELVFDNSEGKLGGEYAAYSEVSLKRVVERDGNSAYFLNGVRCRRKDITQLFLGTGLGSRSYAIIEQNMISRVIEARPEDMRGFLEEAAGISRYKERRRETETRIGHTRENLERLSDLREEVDKQLKHLQRQAATARRYQVLKQEERQLQAQLLALRLREVETEAGARAAILRERDLLLQSALAGQRALEASIERSRAEHAGQSDRLSGVQGRYYEIGAEISRAEQAIEHARELRARQRQEIEQLAQALEEAVVQRGRDAQQAAELAAMLAELGPGLEAARAAEQASAAALSAADQAMHDWQDRWEIFNQRLRAGATAAEAERVRVEELENNLRRVLAQKERTTRELTLLAAADVAASIAAAEADEQTARTAADDARRRMEELVAQLQSERQRERELAESAQAAHREALATEGRIVSLEALQRAALGESGGRVVEWLAASGFVGRPRLAQQLNVDAGWERAVETVLGAYLEAVCVDSIDDVAAALGSLDKGSVGFFASASVRAPERAAARGLREHVRGPAGLDSLLDGVVAAKDLPQALALRGQLEPGQSVITRDGIWIGQDWLRVSRDEDHHQGVIEREQALRRERKHLERLQERQRTVEAGLDALRQQVHAMEDLLADTQSGVAARGAAHLELRAQLDGLRTRTEQRNDRLAALQAQIGELDAELATADGAVQSARARAADAAAVLVGLDEERRRREGERDELRQRLAAAREQAAGDRATAGEVAIRVESRRSTHASLLSGIARLDAQVDQHGVRRADLDAQLAASEQSEAQLRSGLEERLGRRLSVENELAEARRAMEAVDTRLRELDEQRLAAESRVAEAREQLDGVRLSVQELKVRRETLLEQFAATRADLAQTVAGLPEEATVPGWELQLAETGEKIERLGQVNLAAIDEFREQSERKEYLDRQHADLTDALNTLEDAIRRIDRETKSRFQETFERVNAGLKEKFPRLFGGGHAYLELGGEDVLDAGVAIMARPPGKRNSSISQLSGGEKALTAVALVFAIFELNPAPFCLLDEVDAPLDENNVGRFCDIVRDMSSRVQFVFVTHNKATMELANQLLGVTMNEPGVSRLVAVDVDEAVRMAAM
ncbi:MAG TPA: chromosome segregation protein SMC [Burkholderiales bacterium]|nr:chromosome segregation protein SMC [Burkholderiales bacterium]